MCFSAPASFIAGAALVAVGTVTIARSNKKSELPFASIPFIFGVQQMIEGGVWTSVGNPHLNSLLAYLYLLLSHVLWPTFVPFAVLSLEPVIAKRRILYAFLFVGLCVSGYLLYALGSNPMTCQVVNHSIAYHIANHYVIASTFLYLVVTGLSCFVSSHRLVRFFGFALLVLAAVAHQFYEISFISVWCFFGAILSFIIYWYFKDLPIQSKLGPDM